MLYHQTHNRYGKKKKMTLLVVLLATFMVMKVVSSSEEKNECCICYDIIRSQNYFDLGVLDYFFTSENYVVPCINRIGHELHWQCAQDWIVGQASQHCPCCNTLLQNRIEVVNKLNKKPVFQEYSLRVLEFIQNTSVAMNIVLISIWKNRKYLSYALSMIYKLWLKIWNYFATVFNPSTMNRIVKRGGRIQRNIATFWKSIATLLLEAPRSTTSITKEQKKNCLNLVKNVINSLWIQYFESQMKQVQSWLLEEKKSITSELYRYEITQKMIVQEYGAYSTNGISLEVGDEIVSAGDVDSHGKKMIAHFPRKKTFVSIHQTQFQYVQQKNKYFIGQSVRYKGYDQKEWKDGIVKSLRPLKVQTVNGQTKKFTIDQVIMNPLSRFYIGECVECKTIYGYWWRSTIINLRPLRLTPLNEKFVFEVKPEKVRKLKNEKLLVTSCDVKEITKKILAAYFRTITSTCIYQPIFWYLGYILNILSFFQILFIVDILISFLALLYAVRTTFRWIRVVNQHTFETYYHQSIDSQ